MNTPPDEPTELDAVPERFELALAVADIVGAGAVPVDTLIGDVCARHPDADPDEISEIAETVIGEPPYEWVPSGVVRVTTLLDGTSWAVRVDDAEAEIGRVPLVGRLDHLFVPLISDRKFAFLPTGELIGLLDVEEVEFTAPSELTGPDGWLTPSAGAHLVIGLRGDAVTIEHAAPEPVASPRQIEAVRTAFRYVDADGGDDPSRGWVDAERLVLEAVARDRGAFVDAPAPTLDGLCSAAGLSHHEGHVAAAGFDWSAVDRWRRHGRLGAAYRLDAAELEIVDELLDAAQGHIAARIDGFGDDSSSRQERARHLAAALDQPWLALAVWGEVNETVDAAAVLAFADDLVGLDDRPAAPGAHWLLAIAAERAGATERAVEAIEQALAAHADHVPLLLLGAELASDRGDAASAWQLLRRTGLVDAAPERTIPTDVQQAVRVLVDEVQYFATHRPPAMARRNDRCPCGSGRKYKVCHLGREVLPLDERLGWLHAKLARYARRHHAERIEHVAKRLADGNMFLQFAVERAGLTAELALDLGADGLGTRAFVDARGPLLPADEAELARQWIDAPVAVFAVERHHSSEMVLRDVARGTTLTVANVVSAGLVTAGGAILCRPLPVDGSYRLLGGAFPVPAADAELLADSFASGDRARIDEALDRIDLSEIGPEAPIRRTDPRHEMIWHAPKPLDADLAGALKRLGLTTATGHIWSIDSLRSDADEKDDVELTIDAGLGEHDAVLVASTATEAAAERLREHLDELAGVRLVQSHEVPGFPIDDRYETPEDEWDDDEWDDDPRTVEELRAETAELEASLRELNRQFSDEHPEMIQTWLEEPQPLFGGLTPQQAHHSPSARASLDALLAAMDQHNAALAPDPTEIRRLLAL